MKTLMLALMAWGVAGVAQAQDWIPIVFARDVVIGLDFDDLRRDGGMVTISQSAVYASRQMLPSGAVYDYATSRERYDCVNERTSTLVSSVYQIGRNEPVIRAQGSHDDWQYIAPGTFGQRILKTVCDDPRPETFAIPSAEEFARVSRTLFLHVE
ncbi:MAG: hypothetical protein DWQ53_09790 [Microcystis flos-aquae DF17]|nr:MAG: hypothetical protein DWQ53_09790 [Microcystis flos-aquae DF17]